MINRSAFIKMVDRAVKYNACEPVWSSLQWQRLANWEYQVFDQQTPHSYTNQPNQSNTINSTQIKQTRNNTLIRVETGSRLQRAGKSALIAARKCLYLKIK